MLRSPPRRGRGHDPDRARSEGDAARAGRSRRARLPAPRKAARRWRRSRCRCIPTPSDEPRGRAGRLRGALPDAGRARPPARALDRRSAARRGDAAGRGARAPQACWSTSRTSRLVRFPQSVRRPPRRPLLTVSTGGRSPVWPPASAASWRSASAPNGAPLGASAPGGTRGAGARARWPSSPG